MMEIGISLSIFSTIQKTKNVQWTVLKKVETMLIHSITIQKKFLNGMNQKLELMRAIHLKTEET